MPRVRDTSHAARRLRVCAVCFEKGDGKITPALVNQIKCLLKRRYYHPDDSRVPGGICAGCRIKLSQADKGKLRFCDINAPDMERVPQVEGAGSECACRWCCTAKERVGSGQPRQTATTDSGQRTATTSTPVTEPPQITAGTCNQLQVRLGLLTNQTLKMASVIRAELGQSAVQSHLKQELEARDQQLDDWFVGIDLQAESQTGQPAPAVVCSDTSGFLQLVVSERHVDPHDHMVKVGMDGGGGMLKVTANVIGGSSSNNNNSSSSSSGGGSSGSSQTPAADRFLDAGVKRLLLLVVAPGVGESYAVMARLLRELRMEEIGGLYFAADLKMANIICGLQVC